MQDDQHVVLGQLVTSVAGRDHGADYIVVGIDDKPPYIYVANGCNHSVAKPKKKNIRHVRAWQLVSVEMAKKLTAGEKVTDEAVRQAIACLVRPDNL
ncbi:hypothetical protein P22_1242 [Propionispora sp. 2/2-37]|uniref:KOW domain-containing RNA-binding protein n=1 Tax=Propionispora sp. 2/2-37 TaxID=1677858 RepID=UPI0006BB5899|nr:KOW domain-containing RNA-binding protein [Propionispora sp. 2/2-37]CUH95172.1 hypothetical protein P22_1242 [Propionispora sp. 2/2-37]